MDGKESKGILMGMIGDSVFPFGCKELKVKTVDSFKNYFLVPQKALLSF